MTDTDFASLVEPVARHLWGEPNAKLSSKTGLRWGNGGSRSVDPAKGAWFDHEAGEGGNVIELVMREVSCDKAGAIEWLEQEGFIPARERSSGHRDSSGRAEAPPVTEAPPEPEEPPASRAEGVREVEVARYDYHNRDGEFQYRVIRCHEQHADGSWVVTRSGGIKKTFKQKSRDASGNITWGLNGRSPCLYRWQELERAIEAGKTAFIAEGEKDVHTLLDMGLDATTNSGGVGNWEKNAADFTVSFRGADVVILVDNDDAGIEGGEVRAKTLRGIARRIRVLNFADHVPGFDHKGDITDWVEKFGGDAYKLGEILNTLPDWKPKAPKGFGGSSFMQVAGSAIVYDWLIKGLVERNGVFIFAGEKQAGKSFAIMDMGMKIARGLQYGDRITRRGIVIHVACEDGRGVKMRAEGYRQANGIQPDENIPYVIMDREFSLMSDDVIERFIATVKEWEDYYGLPVELIIIDTLSVATEGLNEIDGAEVGKVLARVNRLKDATGAAICLVHHMNASGGRVRGHTSIEANVSQVFEIRPLMTIPQNRRETPQPILDGEGRHIRQIVLTKNKNGLNNLKWKVVLRVVDLGVDADGDKITTCVVDRPARASKDGSDEQQGKLSPDQKIAFDALLSAIEAQGEPIPASANAGSGVRKAVAFSAWRDHLRKVWAFRASEDELEQRNKELSDVMARVGKALWSAGYMGRDNDLKIVWWTGKSDRPAPKRESKPIEPPGAGVPEDVKREISSMEAPF